MLVGSPGRKSPEEAMPQLNGTAAKAKIGVVLVMAWPVVSFFELCLQRQRCGALGKSRVFRKPPRGGAMLLYSIILEYLLIF